MTNVATEPVTRLFTFGYGQTCQFTGVDLGDRYALVTAPDRSAALRAMQATFGKNWAFEYSGVDDPNIADYVPKMTLHAQLVIGAVALSAPVPSGAVADEKPECGAWCADGPGGLCAKDLGHDGDHGTDESASAE